MIFIYILTCFVFIGNIYGSYIQLKIVNEHASLELKSELLIQKDIDRFDINTPSKSVLVRLDVVSKNAIYVDMLVAKSARVMIYLQLIGLILISSLFLIFGYRKGAS